MSLSFPRPESSEMRILVVEPASVYREMQALLLRQAGYRVESADDFTDAFRRATTEFYHIFVLNSDATDADHVEFARRIRSACPTLEVVVVASALTVEMTRALTAAGVRTILARPLHHATLEEKLHEIALARTRVPSLPPAEAISSPRPDTFMLVGVGVADAGLAAAVGAAPRFSSAPPFAP